MTRDEILSMPAERELDWLIQDAVIQEPLSKWEDYPPPYSRDIAYAWDVVDKMRNKFFIASLVADTNLWRVTFYNPKENYEAISESVSLAICRAALLAMI